MISQIFCRADLKILGNMLKANLNMCLQTKICLQIQLQTSFSLSSAVPAVVVEFKLD